MLTADGECRIGLSIGPICNSIARVSRNSSASGISFQAKRGAPMSTVNEPSASFQVREHAAVDLERQPCPCRSPWRSATATQRMPLPQAPASEPSLL